MTKQNASSSDSDRGVSRVFQSAKHRSELLKELCLTLVETYDLPEAWMVIESDTTGGILVSRAIAHEDACDVRLLIRHSGQLPECCRIAARSGTAWWSDNQNKICSVCPLRSPVNRKTYVRSMTVNGDAQVYLGIHLPDDARGSEPDREMLDQLSERLYAGINGYFEGETALPGQRSESDRYSAFFRNMSDGVMILAYSSKDQAFIIKDINAAGGDIAKVAPVDVVGAKLQEIFPKIEECNLFELLNRVWETGEAESLNQYFYKDPRFAFYGKSYISRLESGEVVVIFEDVTERVKAQRQMMRDARARRQAENALINSEAKFRTIYENFPVGIARVSLDYRILEANPAYCRMLGYTEPELIGQNILDLAQEDARQENKRLQNRLLSSEIMHYTLEKPFLHKSGKIVHGLLHATLVCDSNQKPSYFLGCVLDITERKQLESRLYQLQKMDSIGRLAAGVSHDFNNLISPIMGYAQLLTEDLPDDSTHNSYAREIFNAGSRAHELTRQLQAFGRKQNLLLQGMEINGVIRSFQNLLRRVIRENIELKLDLLSDPVNIQGDIGKIEQVIMNLIVNSRDSIGESGSITVKTSVINLTDRSEERLDTMKAGEYLKLQVLDDGSGMTKEVLDQAFEPFFTTKAKGKGTGLGLSTVFGIVNQHKGNVYLKSEPGQGTDATVLIPICDVEQENPIITEPFDSDQSILPKGYTILVVEDDAQVRRLTENLLIRLGYRVISAEGGQKALNLVDSAADDRIDLLLTDVIMPGMNGKITYEKLKSRIPDLKVVFMSGYTGDIISRHGVLPEETHFIQKPFSAASLHRLIQSVIKSS